MLCSKSSNYWLASRSVDTYSELCFFYINVVGSRGLNTNEMFRSDYYFGDGSKVIFPVVSLSSELLESDGGTGFRLISQSSMTE